MPPQCKEGGFPQDLWLGVSADAVSVYKRGEGKPLEVFQYEHILSFGAPLANTYKIVVDERELLFETSEVRGDPGPWEGRKTTRRSLMPLTKQFHWNVSAKAWGNSMTALPSFRFLSG